MHNLITFIAHKYTNFIIPFKCNVTKCHNYDEETSYLEKLKIMIKRFNFLEGFQARKNELFCPVVLHINYLPMPLNFSCFA